MADAASRLTHLPERKFLSHFLTHFQQSKTWCLLPLPFVCRRNLTNMLHNKQAPRVSPQLSSRKRLPPGANGGTSTAGCKLFPTSKIFITPFLSSRITDTPCHNAFCPCKGNLSRSNLSSNTSYILVKYLHLWGITTPATTAWGSSTFGWDAIWHPIRRRIVLQQDCSPSLSDSSKPWTPPPKEPPQ